MNDFSGGGPGGVALVLGGGGSAGNAWLIGVVAGLADGGVPVADADLTVGASAGSTVAGQLAGSDAASLFAAIVEAPAPLISGSPAGARGAVAARGSGGALEATNALIAAAHDVVDMRRRIGAMALEAAAAAGEAAQARWRDTVATRLGHNAWPERRILITAVDAESGEAVVFDRESGVDLVDAVAASCSSSSAYRIGDRLYIDGGYRTNADNADLATGYSKVLVVSPFGGRTRLPLEWHLDLATQVGGLRAAGGDVTTIFPDAASQAAFGDNMMNPASRIPAAHAGFRQGRAEAARLEGSWR